jgi:hypothetical protein
VFPKGVFQLCGVSCASYDPLFIDLGLLGEEVEKILESNYGMELKNRIKSKS